MFGFKGKTIVDDGLPGRRAGGDIEHRVRNSNYLQNALFWTGGTVGTLSAGTILVLNVLGRPVSWLLGAR